MAKNSDKDKRMSSTLANPIPVNETGSAAYRRLVNKKK